MPMSEEKLRDLTALEPPPSIERIVRFFTELGERINSAGVTENQNGPGDVGRKTAAFAKGVTGGSSDMGQGLAHWFTTLMERYQVRVVDLPEFSLWLAKWYDIRNRSESIIIRDDEQAPTWGKTAGRAALNVTLPAVLTGTSYAAQAMTPTTAYASPFQASPADAAPARVYALQRTPSAGQPTPTVSAGDGFVYPSADGSVRPAGTGSVRPAGDNSVRPVSAKRTSWQETQRSGSPARSASGRSGIPGGSEDGPHRLTADEDVGIGPSASPKPSTPGGMSSVAKRRLWTTNLALGGIMTGSLMQSAQAASADPNAIIVGGGPLGTAPGIGMAGPQSFLPPTLHTPFTPGALPLASPSGAISASGDLSPASAAFSPSAPQFAGAAGTTGTLPLTHTPGLAHTPGFAHTPGLAHTPGFAHTTAPAVEHAPTSALGAAAGSASDTGIPAPGTNTPPIGTGPAPLTSRPATQGGLDAQMFSAQRAGQFLPAVQEGAVSARPGAAGPLALAHAPSVMGKAVGAAALTANGLDGSSPVFGFTGVPAGNPFSPGSTTAGTTMPTSALGSSHAAAPPHAGTPAGAHPGTATGHALLNAVPMRLAALPLIGQIEATHGAGASRNLFGQVTSTTNGSSSPHGSTPLSTAALARSPIPARPEMGQITLVAPPMHVASEQAEQGGMATAFDWTNLARSAGALDAGGLARLKQALPPGAQAIYPALPPGSLTAGAVNLALAPSLLGPLLHQGYGPQAAGIAEKVGGMASVAVGGSPTAAPLVARIVPGTKPMGNAAGLGNETAHQNSGPAGALGQAGQASATRGGVLDFLGMPVRLAPSLSGKPELKDEVAVRGGAQAAPGQTVRPNQFASLRSHLFPGMGSVTAEPDKHAWEKAAPQFGLRNSNPTTLLAPDARAPLSKSLSSLVPSVNPTAPSPAARGPIGGTFTAGVPGLTGGAFAAGMPGRTGSAFATSANALHTPTPGNFASGGLTVPSLASRPSPALPVTDHSLPSAPGSLSSALSYRSTPTSPMIGHGLPSVPSTPSSAPYNAPAGSSQAVASMPAPAGLSGGYSVPSAAAGGFPSTSAPPSMLLGTPASRFSPGSIPGAGRQSGYALPSTSSSLPAFGFASPSSGNVPSASGPSAVGVSSFPRYAGASVPTTSSAVGSGRYSSPSAALPSTARGAAYSIPAMTRNTAVGAAPLYRSSSAGRPNTYGGFTPPSSTTLSIPSLPTLSAPSLSGGIAPLRLASSAAPALGTLARSAPMIMPPPLSLGQASSLPLASSSLSAAPSASHATSIIMERAPQMTLAPPSPLAGRASKPEATQSMVIQRVERGMSSAAHSPSHASGHQENPGTSNAAGSVNDVSLLATEVWAHIKGKIKADLSRIGH